MNKNLHYKNAQFLKSFQVPYITQNHNKNRFYFSNISKYFWKVQNQQSLYFLFSQLVYFPALSLYKSISFDAYIKLHTVFEENKIWLDTNPFF